MVRRNWGGSSSPDLSPAGPRAGARQSARQELGLRPRSKAHPPDPARYPRAAALRTARMQRGRESLGPAPLGRCVEHNRAEVGLARPPYQDRWDIRVRTGVVWGRNVVRRRQAVTEAAYSARPDHRNHHHRQDRSSAAAADSIAPMPGRPSPYTPTSSAANAPAVRKFIPNCPLIEVPFRRPNCA